MRGNVDGEPGTAWGQLLRDVQGEEPLANELVQDGARGLCEAALLDPHHICRYVALNEILCGHFGSSEGTMELVGCRSMDTWLH